MEPNNNQMALRGVVLVLALIAAGAFVLARGLDDNGAATTTAPAATATAVPEPTSAPSDTPGDGAGTEPTSAPSDTPGDGAGTEPTPEPTPPPDEELVCRDPSTISVLVANGTDVSGAAGRLSSELNTANYVTLQPTNASPQTASSFYYRAGYEVDAQCVADLLGESEKPLWPMPDPPPGGLTLQALGNAFVLILIGPDSLAQRSG